ncbi:MAG: hypothetical protein HY788_23780 [Deltaproteobacteria bacterium]|nr:hypothetical protein [Deltaproteobacteria bacterium]
MGKAKKKHKTEHAPVLTAEETGKLEVLKEKWSMTPDPANDDAVNEVIEACRTSEALCRLVISLAQENPSSFSVRVLAELETLRDNKEFRKQVRRARHHLKQSGLDRQAEFEKPKGGIYRKAEKREPSAYVSSIDHSGSRIAILSAPRETLGTRTAISMFNETDGFVEFKSLEMSQSEFKGFLKLFEKDTETEVYPTSPGHVCILFREAVSVMSARGSTPPPGYAEWRDYVEHQSPVAATPLIFEYVSKEDIESNPVLLRRSDELIKDDMILPWVLDLDEVEPYIQRVRQAEESMIVMSESQQRVRLAGIYEQAVKTLFTPERRDRMKRRLEETAYLFWRNGKEDLARIAAAASLDVTGEHRLVPENPFLLNLVEASIGLWQRTEAEDEDESGGKSESPLILL